MRYLAWRGDDRRNKSYAERLPQTFPRAAILHSRGARVESNRTHRSKREVWRYCLTARYLHLRFTSELDTSACNMRTPSCYRTNGALIPYLVKKEKRAAMTLFSFLVEVWRFELQASSTRNWRATNCATPRNDEMIVGKGFCFLHYQP